MSEDEVFKVIKSGKRKKKQWKRMVNKETAAPRSPALPSALRCYSHSPPGLAAGALAAAALTGDTPRRPGLLRRRVLHAQAAKV